MFSGRRGLIILSLLRRQYHSLLAGGRRRWRSKICLELRRCWLRLMHRLSLGYVGIAEPRVGVVIVVAIRPFTRVPLLMHKGVRRAPRRRRRVLVCVRRRWSWHAATLVRLRDRVMRIKSWNANSRTKTSSVGYVCRRRQGLADIQRRQRQIVRISRRIIGSGFPLLLRRRRRVCLLVHCVPVVHAIVVPLLWRRRDEGAMRGRTRLW